MSAFQSARPNARLLLVDDHALFRTGLRLIVQDHPSVGAIAEAGSIADACALQQADIDLVLLDIKAFTEETYFEVTGAQLQPTLDFARRLSAKGKKIWLRYVLVPGLTDKLDEIEGLAAFAAELGVVERVDVLPFHKLGEFKWKECGREYKLAETEPPSRELVEQVRSIFRGHGLKAS